MLSEPIDRKFRIVATCREHGHEHTEWDAALFLAKDRALPAALRAYLAECIVLGAAELQIEGVRRLIERVDAWQAANPDRCKVPDIDAGYEWIAGPNQPPA